MSHYHRQPIAKANYFYDERSGRLTQTAWAQEAVPTLQEHKSIVKFCTSSQRTLQVHEMRKILLSFFLAINHMNMAIATERAASDIELKSAYCIGVIKTTSATIDQMLGKNYISSDAAVELQKKNSDLLFIKERLLSYLLPRTTKLDSNEIMTAVKTGESDPEKNFIDLQNCLKNCVQKNSLSKCETSCILTQTERRKRILSCEDSSWVPY